MVMGSPLIYDEQPKDSARNNPPHNHKSRFNPQNPKCDPSIGINWPIEVTDVSARDKKHPMLGNNFSGIEL